MFDGNYQADVLLLAVQFGPRTLSSGVKSASEFARASEIANCQRLCRPRFHLLFVLKM